MRQKNILNRRHDLLLRIPTPSVNYLALRPNNLTSPTFRHLLLLLYWPFFGFFFWFAEKKLVVDSYHPVYSPLDDYIPFCELFVIPYVFWFVFLIGIHVYTALYDIPAFIKLMRFIIITYSITLIIYYLFPTCQNLRPHDFSRDNALTRFMEDYYSFDTHTNVCPSLHVIGSLAVMFTGWHCQNLQHPAWKIAFCIVAVLISVSTVFLKQHSVIDILAALPICLGAYYFCFYYQQKMPKKKPALTA